MGRFSSIEDALIQINDAVFQELCDSFLALRNDNYSAFSRTGSQSGKQKTTRGIPDSFFLLPNGKYLFIEHTTRSSGQKSKLEDDIDDCLKKAEESDIPYSDIEEIILCTNFNLKVEDVKDLKKPLQEKGIRLTLFTLDRLAIELNFNHRDLAHEYLDIPLDTGQIVSIQTFISEYQKASQGIATPLDNKFLHREEEVKGIIKSLNKSDFVILNGSAGVGKTKLAIETIQKYLKENQSFNAYCVSYKNYDLLEDLYQFFDEDKDYILFVDDANRIDAFKQITEFYRRGGEGSLKLLITVRDYAYKEVEQICQEFEYQKIDIGKLTDKEIKDIIESKSFEIKNPDYQKEILRIADGNPRLAIMASLLALKEQNLASLSDVSDLFEKYFSTFIKDEGEFEQAINIKVLGILAFFGTIQYQNREVIAPILNNFSISFSEVIDAIDRLEKLELLQIKYDYVKIPEQNLGMFFFYKAFIKDEVLDFKVLLERYFSEYSNRFNECVIQANNTFGNQYVINKIKPDLNSYWASIKEDKDEAFKFLKSFWFCLPDEALGFAYRTIKEISVEEVEDYNAKIDSKDFYPTNDKIIGLVGNFLRFRDKTEEALDILFEYARRKPSKTSEVIQKIAQILSFHHRDRYINFRLQKKLFDYLVEKLSNKRSLFDSAFIGLSKFFLGFKFEHHESGRGNTVNFITYPIPPDDDIKYIRSKIWNTLEANFKEQQDDIFYVLKNYREGHLDPQEDIMRYDLSFILKIIRKHLRSDSFEHCYLVHELISWYKRNEITHSSFKPLQKEFSNSTYEIFKELNWSVWDDQTIESEDLKEYEKKKEQRLRQKFCFNSIKEFEEFYQAYIKIDNVLDKKFVRGLGVIIHENFVQDFEIGYAILEHIVLKGNEINYYGSRIFADCLDDKKKEEKVWKLISSYEFNNKIEWQLAFFKHLNHKKLEKENCLVSFLKRFNLYNNNKITIHDLLNVYKNIDKPITLHFDKIVRFNSSYPNLLSQIVKVITRKNREEDARISIFVDLFSDHLEQLSDNYELIKKAYLQQLDINKHFDPSGEGFINVLSIKRTFLLTFVKHLYSKDAYKQPSIHFSLSEVWQLKSIEKQIEDVFNWISSQEVLISSDEHFCNVFFKNLSGKDKERAEKFLFKYLEANHNNPSKVDIVIDVLRESFEDVYEKGVLTYLSLNQDVEDFKKIRWLENEGAIVGDANFGDIRASKWRDLLSVVEKSELGIELLPIKNQIKDYIRSQVRYAEKEEQRRFIRDI